MPLGTDADPDRRDTESDRPEVSPPQPGRPVTTDVGSVVDLAALGAFALVVLVRVALCVEALDRFRDDAVRLVLAGPLVALHELALLQVLVAREEVRDLLEAVLGDVPDVLDVVEPVVAAQHREDLVIAAGLVLH